jgi:peptide/nickel transport system substrate-binding protein
MGESSARRFATKEEQHMNRSLRWVLGAALASLALVVAACGGNDNGGGRQCRRHQRQPGGDPGGQEGRQPGVPVVRRRRLRRPRPDLLRLRLPDRGGDERTLYGFKPDNSTTPIPDLATGEPQISSDNKTITVKIRKGVKYAPPVNREVTSKDIKYAFERAFSKNVPNGYAGTYFSSLEGAPKTANTGDIKPISGIQTPDDYTIVFKLKEPEAPLVSQALVLPITTPVPEEYAKKFDAKTPTTYDKNVAFTGPYMIKNNSQGALVGWQQGKRMEIVRNPNWNAKTDFRPAYLDRIVIEMGNDDLTVATRRTLNGTHIMCCDAGLPPRRCSSRR